jgi:hypothetical protein
VEGFRPYFQDREPLSHARCKSMTQCVQAPPVRRRSSYHEVSQGIVSLNYSCKKHRLVGSLQFFNSGFRLFSVSLNYSFEKHRLVGSRFCISSKLANRLLYSFSIGLRLFGVSLNFRYCCEKQRSVASRLYKYCNRS